jgi:DUF4097 and DUF4098 domain-containing protein YvlB
MIRNVSKFALLALALLPLAALADRSVSEHAAMAADGTLDVSTVAGEVSILGWDRNEVDVKGEIGNHQHLDFSADGEHTRVEVRWEGDSHENEDTDLVIHVPATSRVRASTVSADLRARDITNELELQTVSGDIEAEVHAADADVGTISGTIEISGHNEAGTLRLNLVSGDAWVRDIAGNLNVRTVSGDLNIRAGKLQRVRVDTTSGDVQMRGELEDEGRLEIDSTSGDLRLELCGKPQAQYELSSFSGEIEAFDRRGEQRSHRGPTSELRFKVGSGAGLVQINTLSGEIFLSDC